MKPSTIKSKGVKHHKAPSKSHASTKNEQKKKEKKEKKDKKPYKSEKKEKKQHKSSGYKQHKKAGHGKSNHHYKAEKKADKKKNTYNKKEDNDFSQTTFNLSFARYGFFMQGLKYLYEGKASVRPFFNSDGVSISMRSTTLSQSQLEGLSRSIQAEIERIFGSEEDNPDLPFNFPANWEPEHIQIFVSYSEIISAFVRLNIGVYAHPEFPCYYVCSIQEDHVDFEDMFDFIQPLITTRIKIHQYTIDSIASSDIFSNQIKKENGIIFSKTPQGKAKIFALHLGSNVNEEEKQGENQDVTKKIIDERIESIHLRDRIRLVGWDKQQTVRNNHIRITENLNNRYGVDVGFEYPNEREGKNKSKKEEDQIVIIHLSGKFFDVLDAKKLLIQSTKNCDTMRYDYDFFHYALAFFLRNRCRVEWKRMEELAEESSDIFFIPLFGYTIEEKKDMKTGRTWRFTLYLDFNIPDSNEKVGDYFSQETLDLLDEMKDRDHANQYLFYKVLPDFNQRKQIKDSAERYCRRFKLFSMMVMKDAVYAYGSPSKNSNMRGLRRLLEPEEKKTNEHKNKSNQKVEDENESKEETKQQQVVNKHFIDPQFNYDNIPNEIIWSIIKMKEEQLKQNELSGFRFECDESDDHLLSVEGDSKVDDSIESILRTFVSKTRKVSIPMEKNQYYHFRSSIEKLVSETSLAIILPNELGSSSFNENKGAIQRILNGKKVKIASIKGQLIEEDVDMIACTFSSHHDDDIYQQIKEAAGSEFPTNPVNGEVTRSFDITNFNPSIRNIVYVDVSDPSRFERALDTILTEASNASALKVSIPFVYPFTTRVRETIDFVYSWLRDHAHTSTIVRVRFVCEEEDKSQRLAEELLIKNRQLNVEWEYREDKKIGEANEEATIDIGDWRPSIPISFSDSIESAFDHFIEHNQTISQEMQRQGHTYTLHFEDDVMYQKNKQYGTMRRLRRIVDGVPTYGLKTDDAQLGHFDSDVSDFSIELIGIDDNEDIDKVVLGIQQLTDSWVEQSIELRRTEAPFQICFDALEKECHNLHLDISEGKGDEDSFNFFCPASKAIHFCFELENRQMQAIGRWRTRICAIDPVWTIRRFKDGIRFVEVPLDDLSVQELIEHWNLTMKSTPIKKIERIENPRVYDLYSKKKIEIMLRSWNDGNANIHHGWHGTGATDPKMIAENNLSFLYSNQGMWGRAVYVAENASYSGGGYKHTTGSDHQVLYVEMTLGHVEPRKSDSSIREPSPRHDSIKGNTGGSDVYMLYDLHRTYPKYLVTF